NDLYLLEGRIIAIRFSSWTTRQGERRTVVADERFALVLAPARSGIARRQSVSRAGARAGSAVDRRSRRRRRRRAGHRRAVGCQEDFAVAHGIAQRRLV